MSRLLDGARAIVAHIGEKLDADINVELWNGERIPMRVGARDDIRLKIRSPEALGKLFRSPRLMTIVELLIAGMFDIEGGSPLEAIGRWDHQNAMALRKTIDRKLLLKAGWPFLMFHESAEGGLSFRSHVADKVEGGRNDMELIQFHYDVSNEFYELFLDPEMQYSAGYFETIETGLADAQIAKMDRICRKLRLTADDQVLDIGCGWGGMACHAAANFGARVHGVTLSHEQFDAAVARAERMGVSDLVTIELRDFRSVPADGRYDKIIQVGMFEHVGIDNHDAYFAHVHGLLRPGGLYLHQAITRRAPVDPKTLRKRTPYMGVINRYIFPGGELDHIGMTTANLERHAFEVRDVESTREHYYLALKAWSENLYAARDEAVALVGAARVRLWLLYLALSCIGFQRGAIYDFQTLAMRRETGLSGLPLARSDCSVTSAQAG